MAQAAPFLKASLMACWSPAMRSVAMPGKVIWPGVTMSDRLGFDEDSSPGFGHQGHVGSAAGDEEFIKSAD
jgi:hypothetical protein